MKRRDFIRRAAGGALSASAFGPLVNRVSVRRAANWLLIPMDDSQGDHLKAYGVTFRVLERGDKCEWFLNYRGGAFLVPGDSTTVRDAALAGVSAEPVDAGAVAQIRGRIEGENMDAVPLEKAPKVAIYSPPNAAPWDDAVTMALQYAGIGFEKIWDPEVMSDKLKLYDWL
ncbi:MAG: asparagine synthetase B, partial [Gemmatimonadota bacterium]